MTKPVRVRFAPSPTGPLHIGGVRTALFNYLFAKKNQGVFYVRIEDTDQSRFVPGAEAYIFEALKWLGIEPDETVGVNEQFGPYRQSDRKDLYQQYALDLVHKGFAYYAFDTSEELDALRKNAETNGNTFIYNHSVRETLNTSLNMTNEELEARLFNNDPYVIRFKMPIDEKLTLNDMIRGEVTFDTGLLDDKVLYKSDGMPTYHLANIVDDHLQQTSHVIRGEEWLPSLPLHYLLYRSFGWDAPEFAHLPLILKPVGNGKLSKRDGDKLGFPVFPLDWETASGEKSMGYREQGFFPEAVVNFLALLGWNDGTDKELFSMDELIKLFDLSRVNKSGAKFDPEKNKWFNHQYLIEKENADLLPYLKTVLNEKQIVVDDHKIEKIIGLIKDRANLTTDLFHLSDFFFVTPKKYEEKAAKNWKEDTSDFMQQIISVIENVKFFEAKEIETAVKNWIQENELGMGKIMQPLRIAMVGAMKGPDLFEIISLLGKEEAVQRLHNAINNFKK
ncbi:glutamate--tRNA ligase [Flavobacterium sp. CBA20B-1]|uniref:glutamate--tRNA ligase n=1 Tax=unclassified Flavobacterium TaxID=196869 RepID=UPI00222517E4|nr:MULTISPECIES: glutamate--tRNA ligase [unclassified Flavobacterium]WCM41228.1 glutamate--tRNA ligase [Flavobacterium sp. CBA20B-1]